MLFKSTRLHARDAHQLPHSTTPLINSTPYSSSKSPTLQLSPTQNQFKTKGGIWLRTSSNAARTSRSKTNVLVYDSSATCLQSSIKLEKLQRLKNATPTICNSHTQGTKYARHTHMLFCLLEPTQNSQLMSKSTTGRTRGTQCSKTQTSNKLENFIRLTLAQRSKRCSFA
jgi:hypothetical protein